MCEEVDFHVNPIEHYQIIKILDTAPPIFEDCPESFTVSAGGLGCDAEIYLNDYMPIVYDQCGSIEGLYVSVNPGTVYENPVGSGNFYLSNLVPGEHRVRITARDQCSNFSTCEFNVNVEDLQEPNTICESDIVVSLSSSGMSQIPAEVIDDGSFDYCSDVHFQVYRLNEYCVDESDLVPGPYISVCCEDVERSPIMVVLRVWDDGDFDGEFGTIGDHYTECMVEVTVQDKSIPELQCPSNIELMCGQDYTDLDLTGRPSIGFVCNAVESTYVDDIGDLASCNVGQIIRTWTVPSDNGMVECEQIITINQPNTFSESDIVWASDWEGDCNTDQENFTPQFTGAGVCDQLGIQLESDTFFLADDACLKVINYWTVRNWCTDEEYTDTQVLKFIDDTPPVITVADANFISDGSCEAVVELTASADDAGSACPSDNVSWVVYVDIENNGTFDYQYSSYLPSYDNMYDDTDEDGVPDIYLPKTSGGELATLSIPSPVSVSGLDHRVVWAADDGCGNTTTMTSYFTVEDNNPPNAVCINLSSGVMINGELTLWACDFDASSSDNCTPQEDLMFGFNNVIPTEDPTFDPLTNCTSQTFTCDDFLGSDNGMIAVPIYVWDASGNVSICEATLNLIDSSDACEGTFGPTIAGRLKDVNGENLLDVEMVLMDNQEELMDKTMSGEDGRYAFEDIVFGNDYMVEAHKDTLYLNGISTLDIINIQRHILTVKEFETPYQYIAADATGDERVTALDIIEIRKLILGLKEEFSANESWRFVDKNTPMTMTEIWPFSEVQNYNEIPSSVMTGDFVGIKIGDVNFSAIPNLIGPVVSEVRGGDALKWRFDNKAFAEGEVFEVAFTAEAGSEIDGYQFTLSHPGLELIELISEDTEWSSDNYGMLDEMTTISWHDPQGGTWRDGESFIARFQATQSGKLIDILNINSDVTLAEAYDQSGVQVMENVLIANELEFVLNQNNPNPFINDTEILFSLPEAGMVEITVYDNQGRLIYNLESERDAGENSISLSKRDLGNPSGLLTLTMVYKEESQSIKLIVIN